MMTFRLPLAAAALAVALSAPAIAQSGQPQPPAAAPRAASDSGSLQVDRIAAVVGDRPILWTEVMEEINERRSRGLQLPTGDSAQMALARTVIQEMIDEEVIVQRALRGPLG